jgi:hypothetical protein
MVRAREGVDRSTVAVRGGVNQQEPQACCGEASSRDKDGPPRFEDALVVVLDGPISDDSDSARVAVDTTVRGGKYSGDD